MHAPRWLHSADLLQALLALLLAGAVGFLVWKGGEIDGRQQKHAAQLTEIERRLERIDGLLSAISRGDTPLAVKVEHMDKLLNLQNQMNAGEQAQINELKRDVDRIDERMGRIVQALDNTYNTLMNHLRGLPPRHEEKPNNGPQSGRRPQ